MAFRWDGHVQQIRRVLSHHCQGLLTAISLQALGIRLQFAQQPQQSLPGKDLIINHQDLHDATSRG